MIFCDAADVFRSRDLLRVLETNCVNARKLRKEISEIKALKDNYNITDSKLEEEIKTTIKTIESNTVDAYYNKIFSYVLMYKSLNSGFSKEDLLDILPSFQDYHFKDIIFRLKAEIVREEKEINELINEDNFSEEELEELRKLLVEQERRKKILDDIEKDEKIVDDTDDVAVNKVVLIPSRSGKIRIFDELSNVPIEYRTRFLELINSIINGSFKNFKRFVSNDNLLGFCEVRGFQTRVIFRRISKDTYALVSAFIKKSDNSYGYRDYLTARILEYRAVEKQIKENLDNEDFMNQNNLYVEELLDLLGSKEKGKKLRKERRE